MSQDLPSTTKLLNEVKSSWANKIQFFWPEWGSPRNSRQSDGMNKLLAKKILPSTFAASLSICQKNVHRATGWMDGETRKAAEFVLLKSRSLSSLQIASLSSVTTSTQGLQWATANTAQSSQLEMKSNITASALLPSKVWGWSHIQRNLLSPPGLHTKVFYYLLTGSLPAMPYVSSTSGLFYTHTPTPHRCVDETVRRKFYIPELLCRTWMWINWS